jgi:glycosyltransferase involved in cell wall biosynthesis
MKKYNILFLASWYPDKIKPLSGNFIKKHALSVSAFCNVFVIYVRALEQKEKWIIEEKTNEGVFELIVYYKNTSLHIPLINALIKYFLKFKAYKKAYRHLLTKVRSIDLVHLNVFIPAGVFAKYLRKKYNIPIIVTEHWTKFLSISKEKFSWVEKRVIKNVNKYAEVICPVSENLKNEMIKFGLNNKYIVVPNVVNTNIFYPSSHTPQRKKIRFLHISHLEDRHKNITGLLRTFKALSLKRTDFTLTVSGSRNLDVTKKFADTLNFPKDLVFFEGRKNEKEIAESIRNHDVFVMFSHYENLPCVISEALVTGIPVISSDVGGIPEMINEKNGVLTTANDEEVFAEKIIELMNNYDKYDKKVISEEAKKIYGSMEVGLKFYNIYKAVLSH